MKKIKVVPTQTVAWLSREDGFLPPNSTSKNLYPVIYKNKVRSYETARQIRTGSNCEQIAFWAPVSVKEEPPGWGEILWGKLTDEEKKGLDEDAFIKGANAAFAVINTQKKS